MFKLFNKKEKIIYYALNEKNLIYKNEELDFICNNSIIDKNVLDDLLLTGNKVYYNKNEGFYIFNINNSTFAFDKGYSILNIRPMNSRYGIAINNDNEQLFLLDKTDDKKTKLNIENYNWGLIFCSNEFICVQNITTIELYSIKDNNLFWQFNLSELGTYTDRHQEQKQYKVEKIIDIWQDMLIVAVSNNALLFIDVKTGKPIKPKRFESYYTDHQYLLFFEEVEPGAYISTNMFKFDPKNNKLVLPFVVLDLLEGTITYRNLLQNIEIKQNPDFQTYMSGTDFTFNDNLLFVPFTSSKYKSKGTAYIIAFDRKTNKQVWFHKIENKVYQSIKQLNVTENKLYCLDTGGTLHIFEKTDNATP